MKIIQFMLLGFLLKLCLLTTGLVQGVQLTSSPLLKGSPVTALPFKKGTSFFNTLFKTPVHGEKNSNEVNKKYRESQYDDWTFLTAHNAHANRASDWFYYCQQNLSLTAQLNKGVRGLMLDVHPYQGGAYLCHGDCKTIATVAHKGVWNGVRSFFGLNPYQALSDTLQEIKRWVDSHPDEIVTLFLENHMPANDIIQQELRLIVTRDLIFTPADLEKFRQDSVENNNPKTWPTIQGLIDSKKRIIIFNEEKHAPKDFPEPLFFKLFDHVIESKFGVTFTKDAKGNTILDKSIAHQRKESAELNNKKDRSLYTFNFFSYPSTESDAKINNNFENLLQAVQSCMNSAEGNALVLVPHDKKPNFVALDFIDIGDGIKVVKYLNDSSVDTIKTRKTPGQNSPTSSLSRWNTLFNILSKGYNRLQLPQKK